MWLATNKSFFIFDITFYKQLDGVAMGFPLGPTLANAFLCCHEKRWLDKCSEEFKPLFYRRYVNDFLYSSERKNTLNYFLITSIQATKILNLLLKKKPTTNYVS